MTFIERMAALKAQQMRKFTEIGAQQFMPLVIRYTEGTEYTDKRIEPNPSIVSVGSNSEFVRQYMVGLEVGTDSVDSIVVNASDVLVRHIPRTYSRDTFTKDVEYFMVNPEIDPDLGATGGIRCMLIKILDAKFLDWELVLRPLPDQPVPNSQNIFLADMYG